MRRIAMDIETTGLSPQTCRVAAISIAGETNTGGEIATKVIHGGKLSEEEIIQKFVDIMYRVSEKCKIVTYNGNSFDWAFLISRSMDLDDYGKTTKKLFELKEEHGYDMFPEHGDVESGYLSLDDLLKENGLSHDVDCSGSRVPQLVEEEEWELIERYAREDALKTFKLYRKLEC